MKAIFVTGGKQYMVEEGQELYVEKLDNEVESEVVFDEVLYVDGKVVKEEFIDMAAKAKTCYSNSNICSEDGISLADGEYFVMGDNCNNSEDSRVSNIGNIKRSQFVGKIAGTLHKVTRQ